MPDGLSSSRLEDLQMRWQQDPDSRVYLQLAEEYRKLDRHPEAIDVLKRGLRSRPNDLSGQVALGRCHLEMGEFDEAAQALELVVGRDPTHIVGNKLLLEAYLRSGDAARAGERLDLYKLLNQADPDLGELEKRLRGLRHGGPPLPGRAAAAPREAPAVTESAAPPGAAEPPPAPASEAASAEGNPFETWPGRTPIPAERPAEPAPPVPRPAEHRGEAPAARREAPAEILPPAVPETPAAPPAVPETPAAAPVESLFELEEEPPAAPVKAGPEPRVERPRQPPAPAPPAPEPAQPAPTSRAWATSSDDDIFDLGPPSPAPSLDELFDLGPAEQAPAPSLDDLWGAMDSEPSAAETAGGIAAVETVEEAAEVETFETVEEAAAVETVEEAAEVDVFEPVEEAAEVETFEPAEEVAAVEPGGGALLEPIEEMSAPEPAEAGAYEPGAEPVSAFEDDALAEPGPEPAPPEPVFEEVSSAQPLLPEPEYPESFDRDADVAEQAEESLEAEEPEPATATLGELYLKQGHVGEAERIFRQVLQQNPRSTAAMAGLARIRGEKGLTAHALLALGGREAPSGLTAKKIQVLESYVQLLRQAAGRIHVS